MVTYSEAILDAIAKADKTEVNGEKVRVRNVYGSKVFGLGPVARVLGVYDGNVGELAVKMLDLNGPKPLEKKPEVNPYFI
jgi:hypothetical protein